MSGTPPTTTAQPTSTQQHASITLSYTHQPLQHAQLKRILYRRMKNYLRQRHFSTEFPTILIDDRTPKTTFLTTFLRHEYPRIDLTLERTPLATQAHIIATTTMEEEVNALFEEFLNKNQPVSSSLLIPLSVCTQEELAALGIAHLEKQTLHPLLAQLVNHQPTALFSAHKSLEAIKNKKM